MNNWINKIGGFLIPITFGGLIYFSYAELSTRLQEPLITATLQTLGKESLLYISQFFSKKDLVHVMAALSNLPLALGLSIFWIVLARNISTIKSKISYSILVSLIPFFVIYFLLFYINIVRVEFGYEQSSINSAFGYMSDTLAAVFVSYYFLLLLFKVLLIRPKGENRI